MYSRTLLLIDCHVVSGAVQLILSNLSLDGDLLLSGKFYLSLPCHLLCLLPHVDIVVMATYLVATSIYSFNQSVSPVLLPCGGVTNLTLQHSDILELYRVRYFWGRVLNFHQSNARKQYFGRNLGP